MLHPDRVTKEGVPFHIDTPDWVVAAVELADGSVVRLTTNFYVGPSWQAEGTGVPRQSRLALYWSSFQDFHAGVEFAEYAKPYEPVELVRPPFQGVDWGRSVAEIAAIAENRPQRSSGAQAVHVVEICSAISESLQSGRPVEVASSFSPPWPMEWGE